MTSPDTLPEPDADDLAERSIDLFVVVAYSCLSSAADKHNSFAELCAEYDDPPSIIQSALASVAYRCFDLPPETIIDDGRIIFPTVEEAVAFKLRWSA